MRSEAKMSSCTSSKIEQADCLLKSENGHKALKFPGDY